MASSFYFEAVHHPPRAAPGPEDILSKGGHQEDSRSPALEGCPEANHFTSRPAVAARVLTSPTQRVYLANSYEAGVLEWAGTTTILVALGASEWEVCPGEWEDREARDGDLAGRGSMGGGGHQHRKLRWSRSRYRSHSRKCSKGRRRR